MTPTLAAVDQFRQAIEQAGLHPPDDIIADRTLHRFASNGDPEDSAGWYILFADGLPAGAFGDWRSGLRQTWSSKSDATLTPAERDEQRQRFAEVRRQREREEQRRHRKAAACAQRLWNQAAPAPADQPYLRRKQIGTHGLRIDFEDQLIVPVLIDGEISSLQVISPEGAKKFLPDGKVKGGCFGIGDLRESESVVICVCEGFATAASIHEATGLPVVMAFSAGNLKPVAMTLRAQYPSARIVLAADNDLHADGKDNTGVLAATETAKSIDGLLAVPELDGKKCDWNDVHVQCGLDAVKGAIEAVLQREAVYAIRDSPTTATPDGDTSIRFTDVGNGERFAQHHREHVRFCYGLKQWLVWDGQRWNPDTDQCVMRLAKQTAKSFYGLAERASDGDVRKALAKWAVKSEEEPRLNSMLSLARSEPGIAISMDQLDSDPLLLNVLNGTLDLRTGDLRPAHREDFITKLVPVPYRPEAVCPEFERLLTRLFETVPTVREYLQRIFGYSLTGLTSEQCFFIFYGTGSNGKSTILRAILDLLGDYGITTRPETFLVKRGDGIPNDIAALAASRMVVALESEQNKQLAEGLMKGMTGGDKISARKLHQEYFTFAPQFKLFIGTNHKPTIRGTDHAMWRRVRCIPFVEVIPDHEQDKQLSEKLRAEFSGILNLLVQGCLAWQRDGLGPPLEVQQATAAYRAEQDVLGAFLKDRCVLEPTAKSVKKELYENYIVWCEENGERDRLTMREFTKALREQGMVDAKVGKAKGCLGLRLRTPLDVEPDDDELVAAQPEVLADES
jgi:P4 family phage/plasmid primase-like protien